MLRTMRIVHVRFGNSSFGRTFEIRQPDRLLGLLGTTWPSTVTSFSRKCEVIAGRIAKRACLPRLNSPIGAQAYASWSMEAVCHCYRKSHDSLQDSPTAMTSDVEILDLECVFFNEVSPWLHVITHQGCEQAVGGNNII